jgi:hypothetical protein
MLAIVTSVPVGMCDSATITEVTAETYLPLYKIAWVRSLSNSALGYSAPDLWAILAPNQALNPRLTYMDLIRFLNLSGG